MANKSKEKGNALEKTVRLIQEAILKSDPKFAGSEFSIQQNEIVIVAGVKHEIDVLVKTLRASQYESTWIFECKNWNKPVGKIEVIHLAEKIRALGAARGFLVAHKFTSSAEAQVKLESRLSLIHCTDEFSSNVSFELTHAVQEPEPIQISIKQRGMPPLEHPKQLDSKNILCFFNGKETNFGSFLFPYVEGEMKADQQENQTKYCRESSHYNNRSFLIEFEPNEFLINGNDIEYIRVDIGFWVKVQKLKLISKFELKNQGQVFSFESPADKESGLQLAIDIVRRI